MVEKINTAIVKQGEQESIAIIGIGCRFPGGSNNPTAFWDLLINGKDAIIDVPKDRWDIRKFYDPNPGKPGKMYVKSGGFLQERIDQFDALFFGISPREADNLDPQQRILLEVAWEALEDGGLAIEQLAGSNTGVYIGGFTLDNKVMKMSPLNREFIGSHGAVSSSMTLLSNRLSYFFDFRGPSVSMDTACSSSLATLHYACQALWQGECSLALAGGVNIMFRPEYSIVMSKGRFLSPDGHCKSFDERADGYGRGEGAGIVILKPLSAAQQDGDNIYALVRGTGINHDGRTSSITVPNPESQKALIRQVCAHANVKPQQIYYVEAHGTGTAVGDPIECNALGSVLGNERSPENACVVGSVKANIGHLEAASGIAGLIKTSLCLKYKQIPPVANLENPNPKIPFETIGLRLPRKLEPMPDGEGHTYVGINSFGYGGTNAHAILEEAPVKEKLLVDDASGMPYLLPLSARSEKALSSLAQSYIDFLSKAKVQPLRDICYSASVRRDHHNHRLAITADSREDLIEQLKSFVSYGMGEHLSSGKVVIGNEAKPVFVFTGMGPQWWAMGHELLQHEPVFRKVAEECDAIFQRLAGWSILAEMKADENYSKIGETQIAQPANFVLQAALTALWRSRGIEPAAIVGHSVGEVTAAHIAGILDLEDAIRVSYHRSRIQKKAVGQGKMLAIGLTADKAQSMLEGYEAQVSFAAINSPSAVTLSGESEALEEIAAKLEAKGVFNRFLRVELAYHSQVMEPLKDELRESLSMLRPKAPTIPFYSTVLGQLLKEATCDAEYWCKNIRQPVLFAKSIENIINDGYQLFLEVGPHPVLSTYIKECMLQIGIRGNVLTSLHRKQTERATLSKALGALYTTGYPVDWQRLYPARRNYVQLPTYPWQRESYWNESEESLFDRLGGQTHPLLGSPLITMAQHLYWEGTLNMNFIPWLVDHRIEKQIVLPGAAYVEIGLAFHKEIEEKEACVLEEIKFHNALVIDQAEADTVLRVSYDKTTHEYAVYSTNQKDNLNWTLHTTGRLSPVPPTDVARIDLNDIRALCKTHINPEQIEKRLSLRGLQYGPSFQNFRGLWIGQEMVLAQIDSHSVEAEAEYGYLIHPTLLDAGFQSLIAIIDDADTTTYIPVSIRKIRFYSSPSVGNCWAYGVITTRTQGNLEGDITLCDESGNILVEVHGLRCQALTRQKTDGIEQLEQWTYDFVWEKVEAETTTHRLGRWLLFSDQGGVGERLAEQLHAAGVEEVIKVSSGIIFQQENTALFQIRHDSKEDMQKLLDELAKGKGCDGVVYLWGLDASTEDRDPTGTAASITYLHLLQALEKAKWLTSPRLFIVTSGVQQVHPNERAASLAQAPLVGLGRVTANEHPDFSCTIVDIDDDTNTTLLLGKELIADSKEDDVALRGVDRYVHRLMRTSLKELEKRTMPSEPIAASSVQAFGLEVGTPGIIESLRFREIQRQEPGPGEVEIEIHAAAINFKDVLKVMKMLPELAIENTFHRDNLGMESAGIIARVGEGVKDFQVGDAIVASLRGCFRSHVTTPVNAMLWGPKIEHFNHADGASLLVVFMTAYYGLHEIARLQPGEKVLIHAATGGVGLAAIQVAQWIGAEIFATAGNQEKRDYLNSLGIKHIMDSRTVDFADYIMTVTKGQGVDVVLNSIAGEAAIKSFSILAPFGRFIEIGKRDIVENNRLAMLPFNRNLTFAAIDLDRMMLERPELFQRMMNDVWNRFRARDFTPSPIKLFPAAQITDAFRYMAKSKHIGKIVVSMRELEGVSVLPIVKKKTLIKPEGTYLITGGFGGFGLEVAKWMAEQGAQHLVLVGRRGATTTEARQTVQALEDEGIRVLAAAIDVTQESQVAQLMKQIADTMPPLRGVIHAVGVLDDCPLIDLDEALFSKVMAPKALGAWHLHQQTQQIFLDFFILFSSLSSLIGNPRQGNYVAANVFLDTLAHYRRAQGLPATSINWGSLTQVGMVADKKVGQYLELMGITSFTSTQALEGFAQVLYWNPEQIGIMDVDWQKLGQFNPAWAASPRSSYLPAKKGKQSDVDNTLISKILDVAPGEREEMLVFLLAEMVTEILRIPPDKVDVHQPLTNMGMDSLIAVELQTAISLKIGAKLTTLELLKENTITLLAKRLMVKLGISREKTTTEGEQHMEQLDDLADNELDDLLENLMQENK